VRGGSLNKSVRRSAAKSCSFPRRSCARVRRAWRPAPVAGEPRPSAPGVNFAAVGPCAARASAPGCGRRRCGCRLDRAQQSARPPSTAIISRPVRGAVACSVVLSKAGPRCLFELACRVHQMHERLGFKGACNIVHASSAFSTLNATRLKRAEIILSNLLRSLGAPTARS